MLRLAPHHLEFALGNGLLAVAVDGAVLGRGHQPAGRIGRDPRRRPLLECHDERLLRKFLRFAEVTGHPGESCDQPWGLHPPDRLDGPARRLGGWHVRHHSIQPPALRCTRSAKELRGRGHEAVGVVEPGIVASPWLHYERGIREQPGELRRRLGWTVQVELAGEQQGGRPAGQERRTRGLRVEAVLGREQRGGLVVALLARGRMVPPCLVVPPAPEEGSDGLPVVVRALACGDRFKRGVRRREPRLVLPELCSALAASPP